MRVKSDALHPYLYDRQLSRILIRFTGELEIVDYGHWYQEAAFLTSNLVIISATAWMVLSTFG